MLSYKRNLIIQNADVSFHNSGQQEKDLIRLYIGEWEEFCFQQKFSFQNFQFQKSIASKHQIWNSCSNKEWMLYFSLLVFRTCWHICMYIYIDMYICSMNSFFRKPQERRDLFTNFFYMDPQKLLELPLEKPLTTEQHSATPGNLSKDAMWWKHNWVSSWGENELPRPSARKQVHLRKDKQLLKR